nr:MAG TPA: putative DNA double strand break repair [Caudoviricetes sp.]
MKSQDYQIAIIADLHLGVLPAQEQKEELDQVFFHDLKLMEKLDLIVLCGDTYDHKFYVNDKTTDLCLWFYQELFTIALAKHAKIRIIYGTKSHEADQYNLLYRFYKLDVDVKVIDFASEEEIFPNINVLYLPEEHIYNKREYYEEFLYNAEKQYDYIFGHGVIDDIMTTGKKQKEDGKRLHVPHFASGELVDICKGFVFFGHYHIHSSMKGKVYYIGSYNRWEFGQEEPKGYMISNYCNGKYDCEFVENSYARTYKTFRYGYNHKIFESSDELLKEFLRLENMIQKGIYNKIRCMVNIPLTIDNPEFYILSFNERFKHNPDIKVEITNGYQEEKRNVNKEELKEVVDQFHFVLEDIDIKDKISKFIEMKRDRKISGDKVKLYLDSPLKIDE